MKRALFIVYSYHHFLVAVSKTEKERFISDIIFSNSAYKSGFEKFTEKLKKTDIFNKVIFYDELKYEIPRKRRLFKYYWYELWGQKKYFVSNSQVNVKDYDEIFVFSDVFTVGAYFSHDNIRYHLLEDTVDSFSRMNYGHSIEHCNKKTFRGRIFWLFNLGHMLYGNDDSCIDIEINSISENTVELPKNKIKIVDRNAMIFDICDKTKQIILGLFDIGAYSTDEKCALVLTEPLHRDGRVDSDNVQIKMYQEMISRCLGDYRVFIKPHPRDNVNYNELSETVLGGDFPIEVLGFLDSIHFDFAVSYTTPSVNSLLFIPNRKVLGEEVFEEMKKIVNESE